MIGIFDFIACRRVNNASEVELIVAEDEELSRLRVRLGLRLVLGSSQDLQVQTQATTKALQNYFCFLFNALTSNCKPSPSNYGWSVPKQCGDELLDVLVLDS